MTIHLKKLIVSKTTLVFFASALLVSGCASHPYKSANKQYKALTKEYSKQLRRQPDLPTNDSILTSGRWVGTVNFNLRKPHFVILHHTAQESCEKTIQTFTTAQREVSAHYVICKDGTVHHMLNDYFRAWHAGQSKWGQVSDINSVSIGIELDNNGTESFNGKQIDALLALLNNLKTNYNIPKNNFLAHGDIAPGRKVDPNVKFPWQLLSERGFGAWYGDTTSLEIPSAFDPALALRLIGYDTSRYMESLLAFRRHYLGSENTGAISDAEKKILYSLMMQNL